MEREYDKSNADVIELGVAHEVTNGIGVNGSDAPDQQPLSGILED